MTNLARHHTEYPQLKCGGPLWLYVEPNALRSYPYADWIVQRCLKCGQILEADGVIEEVRYL